MSETLEKPKTTPRQDEAGALLYNLHVRPVLVRLGDADTVLVSPTATLTDSDRAALARLKPEIVGILKDVASF